MTAPRRSRHTDVPVLPGLGPIPKPKRITSAERTLASGLHVIVVRRTGVPLVELRLRLPFQSPLAAHPAQAELLADSLLAGTAEHTRDEIASRVQSVGGSLSTSVDADRLVVAGSGLATGLPVLLDVLAEVLTGATYPQAEVVRNRARLVERLTMARSQAGVIAHEAMARRLWGEHPYVHDMPAADDVAATTAPQVRRLHERRGRAGRGHAGDRRRRVARPHPRPRGRRPVRVDQRPRPGASGRSAAHDHHRPARARRPSGFGAVGAASGRPGSRA